MPQKTLKFLAIFFISILNLNLLLGSKNNFKKKSSAKDESTAVDFNQNVVHGRMGHNFINFAQISNRPINMDRRYYQHQIAEQYQTRPADFNMRPYQYQALSHHLQQVSAAYQFYPTPEASYFNQVSYYPQHPQNPLNFCPRIQNRQNHISSPIFTPVSSFNQVQPLEVDPVDVLEKKIFEAIFDVNYFEPFNSHYFLSDLSEISLFIKQNARTHLQWFIEFIYLHFKIQYQDNLINYFDYIKVNHIVPELDIDSGVDIIKVIHFCILKLIEFNCRIPDVIKSLCQLGHKSFTPMQSKEIYAKLRNSIELNEMTQSISAAGYYRYVSTIEILLEFVKFSKEDVMLPAPKFSIFDIEPQVSTVSMLRAILHFAPLYHALLGFQETSEELIKIIKLKNIYLDGSAFTGDRLTFAKCLNFILKRAYFRLMNLPTDEKIRNVFVDRFENAAKVLVSFFKLDDFYFFVSNYLDFLADTFIIYKDEKIEINFETLIKASYKNFNRKLDKFNSLCIISMYIATNPITLNEFRENHLSALYDFDYDFLLALETLIAAVEEVGDDESGFFITWEPSREFLALQQQILMFQYDSEEMSDPKFHLLDSSYLLLAAKIFLTRQHGYQISYFQTKFVCENSSWKDVIDFVNFFMGRLYEEEIAKILNLTSEFCKDMDNFPNLPAFEEMMTIYDLKNYQSKKIYYGSTSEN